jgi:pyruvate carboxylase
MREALRETVLLGISTNIPFHLRVLEDPDFVAGRFSTRFIEEHPALLSQDATLGGGSLAGDRGGGGGRGGGRGGWVS